MDRAFSRSGRLSVTTATCGSGWSTRTGSTRGTLQRGPCHASHRHRAGHVGVAGDAPAPRVLGAADRPMRVVWNGSGGGGVPSSPTHDAPVAGDQVARRRTRRRARTPGTAWPGRCTGRGRGGPSGGPPASRRARQRRQRPQQHRHALALVAAHHVGAPVHAVGEVHVQAAGRPEHRAVAGRHAPEGVAARVGRRRSTPRPRRCARASTPVGSSCTSTLPSRSGASVPRVAPVGVPVERHRRETSGRSVGPSPAPGARTLTTARPARRRAAAPARWCPGSTDT